MKKKSWLHGWKLWAAVAIVAITTALLIAQDQETLRVQSPVAATDTRYAEYVASLVSAQVHSGNTFTVLRNGVEVFPAMLDAIRRAERRVNLESYIYEDGEVGDQFTAALADAARRGLTVRIVLDAVGATLSSKSQKALTDAGAQLVWFNTVRPWSIEETNYRTHRKLLAVDGQVAYLGGVGLADHWLGNADAKEHWRDTQVRVEGPAARAIEAAFYENWLEAGGQAAPMLDPDATASDNGTRTFAVWSNPTAGVSNVKLLYLLAIAGARRTIDIESPYITLDETTQWSIDEARRRGVRVRIVTDGDVTDSKPVKASTRQQYDHLLERGCEIYEYQPTMMHTKALIVDGLFSITGSANFDNRSFELNDELTVGAVDPKLAADLTRDFEHDRQRSKQITLEEWRRRGVFEKTQEYFWSFFGEIF